MCQIDGVKTSRSTVGSQFTLLRTRAEQACGVRISSGFTFSDRIRLNTYIRRSWRAFGNATTAEPHPANLFKQGAIVDETSDETVGAARVSGHGCSGYTGAPLHRRRASQGYRHAQARRRHRHAFLLVPAAQLASPLHEHRAGHQLFGDLQSARRVQPRDRGSRRT